MDRDKQIDILDVEQDFTIWKKAQKRIEIWIFRFTPPKISFESLPTRLPQSPTDSKFSTIFRRIRRHWWRQHQRRELTTPTLPPLTSTPGRCTIRRNPEIPRFSSTWYLFKKNTIFLQQFSILARLFDKLTYFSIYIWCAMKFSKWNFRKSFPESFQVNFRKCFKKMSEHWNFRNWNLIDLRRILTCRTF